MPEGSDISRWELSPNKAAISLPEIGTAEYYVQLLDEAGTLSSTGMGAFGLSWTDIKSWIDCTGLELTPWELMTIKDMSREYAAQANAAVKKECPDPYRVTAQEEVKDKPQEEAEVKQLFRKRMER